MRELVVLATTPSPYQAELLDAIESDGEFRLRTIYMVRRHADRMWKSSALQHDHVFWTDGGVAQAAARRAVQQADLVVFAWYAEAAARALIRQRARSGGPWAYWGERPGFSGWKWLGQMRRRIQLAPLYSSAMPIWGMGSWAVRAWRKEFGDRRTYHNVPYFSNLRRFAPSVVRRPNVVRRFLFSGTLSQRKGVDLLAQAFAKLAAQCPAARLDIVGVGPWESRMQKQLAACSSQVRFLGFRQWEQLPACYHQADILVAPSRYDGWGLIVPEGLAAGLPVIETDQMGAALELIYPGVNGWRVPAGDLAALSEVLAEAADLSDARLQEMSAAAVASVAKHTLADGVRIFSDAARSALNAAASAEPLTTAGTAFSD